MSSTVLLLLIPATMLVLTAGAFVRAWRRRRYDVPFPQEPVSGQWLAEARGRGEHHW